MHIAYIYRIWSDAIKVAMKGNIWVENKRFNSFAPERNHCTASWSVIYTSTYIAYNCRYQNVKVCACVISEHMYHRVYVVYGLQY